MRHFAVVVREDVVVLSIIGDRAERGTSRVEMALSPVVERRSRERMFWRDVFSRDPSTVRQVVFERTSTHCVFRRWPINSYKSGTTSDCKFEVYRTQARVSFDNETETNRRVGSQGRIFQS